MSQTNNKAWKDTAKRIRTKWENIRILLPMGSQDKRPKAILKSSLKEIDYILINYNSL